MKRYDVVALGELLIDFTENGISAQGNPLMEANPGGAPCNVLSMLQKLDRKTAFIGKVGDDAFGHMLKNALRAQGIDTGSLSMDKQVPTTLAFVHTAADGDRSFSFYRNPGADMMLRSDEVDINLLEDAAIFHFGTLSMTDEQVRDTTRLAVQRAKEAGAWISFDPNLRPPLWRSLEEARECIWYGVSQCDILKISDDEIAFLTESADIDEGIARIQERYQPTLICATMGKDGSKAYYRGQCVFGAPFLQKNTIETTGAGDTFMAGVLNAVLESGLDGLTKDALLRMLEFANAAASIITTRKGALKVMPDKEEISSFIQAERGWGSGSI